MAGNTQQILKQLFRTDGTIEEIALEQIEAVATQYPYFGVGHFLLSRKLQTDQYSHSFSQQTQKTALYFSNPFWLQWLLRQRRLQTNEKTEVHATSKLAGEDLPDNAIVFPIAGRKMADTIGKTVQEQSTVASRPLEPDAIAFEPYHTIDYFASQGIRFNPEGNPQDKLGRQLKSFTEWLKTMKKLPQQTLRLRADEPIDPSIELNAAHSVSGKEVVTEAMAEVLAKQGKQDKAEEVYNKLSLHFPEKSAYFAARIQELKAH